MINYEPTQDEDFIRKCVTEPIVWRAGTDDGLTDIEPDFFFFNTDGKLWLRAEDYGLFMGEPRNSVTYEVHTMLLHHARGMAVEIAKGAIDWMFSNTKCLRITTHVPAYNLLAKRLSVKCGMELIGIDRKSFLKDGCLYDQYVYGISKGELCQD
jgi:hypothetical protein